MQRYVPAVFSKTPYAETALHLLSAPLLRPQHAHEERQPRRHHAHVEHLVAVTPEVALAGKPPFRQLKVVENSPHAVEQQLPVEPLQVGLVEARAHVQVDQRGEAAEGQQEEEAPPGGPELGAPHPAAEEHALAQNPRHQDHRHVRVLVTGVSPELEIDPGQVVAGHDQSDAGVVHHAAEDAHPFGVAEQGVVQG